jgi:hypothetical protein
MQLGRQKQQAVGARSSQQMLHRISPTVPAHPQTHPHLCNVG